MLPTRNTIAAALISVALLTTLPATAAVLTFNAPTTDISATRDAWLAAIGIAAPQYLVDFESGFVDGQNISGLSGLLPGALVITDTSTAGSARIEGTPGGIGASHPVGTFALEHNEAQFLELDFSAAPVDYVAFRDIDHTGTGVIIHFLGGGTTSINLETTLASGNSAEFFGLYRFDQPPIVRLQLDASGDAAWGIDNIEYGVVVPLPAAAWLLGSALFGLACGRRSRRRRAC